MTKIIIKSLIRCKNSDEKSILFEKSEDNLMNDLDIYNILVAPVTIDPPVANVDTVPPSVNFCTRLSV